MKLISKITLLTALAGVMPAAMQAQFDFKLASRPVQIHSFGSQGFMYSNQNNYMSMPTSKGSFAFTDGGANVSSRITDKFRVGAQVYMRNVGEFGNWRPTLDWAYGDYKFKSWFGLRGGKVKTTLGLYNDVQDMDSLHTFALLPQSINPVDWRSTTIAHVGGDVYGDISVKRLGTVSYVGYGGARPGDTTQGYFYAWRGLNTNLTALNGRQVGGDIRWTLPVGAVFGASILDQDVNSRGESKITGVWAPFRLQSNVDQIIQYYGQYTFKSFKLDVEHRRNLRDYQLYYTANPSKSILDSRGFYMAGTYRINKWLEVGAYRSLYYVDQRKDTSVPGQHSFDTTVSGRVDFKSHWYLKAEGHFIDGAPTTPAAARGFYTLSNPAGIQPTTNLLVLRTGFAF